MVNCYDVDYCDGDHNNDDERSHCRKNHGNHYYDHKSDARIDHDNGVCEADTIVTHTTKTRCV